MPHINFHPHGWLEKSFMEFGIKKSHEMINYNLSWIALLSEWEHVSSTKPCNLAQMTLEEFYNRSYERFMSSRYQENATIGLKLLFKLYRDASLTCVDQSLRLLAWQWNLNKSWSLSGVEQILFFNQELDHLVSKSNWVSNFESTVVFRVRKIC